MKRTLPFANQVLEVCDSTNDVARELGEAGYPHGTWVSARDQERGRGRMGREWRAVEGNLFLSILLRPRMSLWSWIPLACAVGATEALIREFPGIGIEIKWPNDLWIRGAKLGGILCEGVGNAGDSFIIAGIGLNCARSPKNIDQDATSLSEARGAPIHADRVREPVIQGILRAVSLLETSGPEALRAKYESLAALKPGTWIEWTAQKGASAQSRSARVVGLGASGELCVEDAQGKSEALFAEDVRVRPDAKRA